MNQVLPSKKNFKYVKKSFRSLPNGGCVQPRGGITRRGKFNVDGIGQLSIFLLPSPRPNLSMRSQFKTVSKYIAIFKLSSDRSSECSFAFCLTQSATRLAITRGGEGTAQTNP